MNHGVYACTSRHMQAQPLNTHIGVVFARVYVLVVLSAETSVCSCIVRQLGFCL